MFEVVPAQTRSGKSSGGLSSPRGDSLATMTGAEKTLTGHGPLEAGAENVSAREASFSSERNLCVVPVSGSSVPEESGAAPPGGAPCVVQAMAIGGRGPEPAEAQADRVAEWVTGTGSGSHSGGRGIVPARLLVAPHSARADGLSSGQPLEPTVRARMEPRFGFDFSGVRVHTGAEADRSAHSYGALAYTQGRDVVFAAGRYAPFSSDGGRLLAHELTHVVQQAGAAPGAPQLMPAATRFQDEPTLEDISDGKKVLKKGDTGEAVIRITTALSELGHYGTDFIDEIFGPRLYKAVTAYQTAKGLTGKVPEGTVEKQTFDELDHDFAADFQVERGVLAKQKSADIMKETQFVGKKERKAANRAISTETPVNPITGLPPVFQPDIVGIGKYADRLRAAADAEIVSEWDTMGKGKTAAHAAAGSLYDDATVDSIAVEAQKAVNAVFGEYLVGRAVAPPPLKMGVTIQDAWQTKESELTAGGKAEEDKRVAWRVQKILDGDAAVKAIDRDHGAIQTRAAEQAIVAPIKSDLMTKYRAELLETDKAWPAFAIPGVGVFVQLFKGATDDEQRHERWDFFQTFIHEYIHTLEHPDHIKYREKLDEQKGGFTLREGTTDYFTKIVWSSLTLDDPLRAKIEGPVHDPLKPFAVQSLNTYDEAENAERLAGVVGIRNEAAAFFLGKVELIGKT